VDVHLGNEGVEERVGTQRASAAAGAAARRAFLLPARVPHKGVRKARRRRRRVLWCGSDVPEAQGLVDALAAEAVETLCASAV
jgi:hypothetical protein